ncbi:MAG: hypothetical protein JWP37_1114 [Mucilaginibacter sp.]|nr:hypothetical protein [Mucilaginibacter sp.]
MAYHVCNFGIAFNYGIKIASAQASSFISSQ